MPVRAKKVKARVALVVFSTFALPEDLFAQTLTLLEAIRLADENTRANMVAELGKEAAEWQRASAWSQLGPKVQLSYDYQYWNEPIVFKVDLPPELKQIFPGGVGEGIVRPRQTYTFGVTVAQPITPMYQLLLAARLASLGADMKTIELNLQRRKTRLQVVETFFGILESQGQIRALTSALEASRAHLTRVERFYAQGLLRQDDVLQVKVRQAQVEQALALAKMRRDVLCAQLNLLMGKQQTASCDGAEEPETFEDIPSDVEACVAEAMGSRLDVLQARMAVDMARTTRLLKAGEWLPQVTGLFNYSRSKATQFSHPEAWFLGVSLGWNVWEWGRTYFDFRAASEQLEAAKQTAKQVEEYAALEVRSRWLEVITAKENLERSEVALVHARENLRIQQERSKVNLNTTSDVLDAEALAIQAEVDRLRALYGLKVALYRLMDAMGR